MASGATTQTPIWVSRKNADNMIAQFSVPLWLFMIIGSLLLLNVLVWSGIGLNEAARVIA
jgi:hypothetical protein